MGQVHLLPGTTYSNIQAKGSSNPEKTASMTLPDVERWLGHAIAGVYHRSLHKGIGATPLAAWKNRDLSVYHERTVSDPRRFLVDFLPMERRLIRREGIVLHSIAYWSDVLREMVRDPEPAIVRYDPRDLSRIFWLAPDGNYYDLNYADVRRPPITLWEHRLARKTLRAEGCRHVDEDLIFAAIDEMQRITAGAIRDKKHIRQQERRRIAGQTATVAANALTVTNEPPLEVTAMDGPLFDVEEWS